MNIRQLEDELQRLGIPASLYSIGVDRDEALCLLGEEGLWQVFFSERGSRQELRKFRDEDEACQYFRIRLLDMNAWRSRTFGPEG